MPLYKYRCSNCNNTFKILQQNGKKDEEPKCPVCGDEQTERVISSVGIRFKGSGFYRTDYGNKNYKGNGGNDGKNENGDSSGNPEKSEEKGTGQGEG
ncbi:MAG: FmdB family zinc ribbon protein [Candidatus Bipolaricaulia bacterium]